MAQWLAFQGWFSDWYQLRRLAGLLALLSPTGFADPHTAATASNPSLEDILTLTVSGCGIGP